ncbi:MAG: YggT family protein [Candidatus Adiutrix sp.]
MVFIGQFIYYATYIYVLLIVLRVLLTWINPNPNSPMMLFLASATDPVLNQGRRLVKFTLGGIDFSPVLVILLISMFGFVVGKGLYFIGLGAPIAILLPLVSLTLIGFVGQVCWVIIILMAVRLLMSLVNPAPYNILVLIVYGLTEPLLAPLRGFFPKGPGGLDLRALIFLVVTVLIQQVLVNRLDLLVSSWIVTYFTAINLS